MSVRRKEFSRYKDRVQVIAEERHKLYLRVSGVIWRNVQ
jgi:hypothetical protein